MIDTRHFSPLQKLTSWERTCNGLVAKVDDTTMSIDVLGKDMFRIQIPAEGQDPSAPSFAISADLTTLGGTFSISETSKQEDDGETLGYRRGERLTTVFRLSRHGKTLALQATTTGEPYPGFARTEFHIHLRGARDARTHIVPATTEGFSWTIEIA